MECCNIFAKDKCKILKVKNCTGCAFFRTRGQSEKSLKAASARLASLENSQQLYIADKYYGGKMPWHGTEGITTRNYFMGFKLTD